VPDCRIKAAFFENTHEYLSNNAISPWTCSDETGYIWGFIALYLPFRTLILKGLQEADFILPHEVSSI
jgi:hypothetical protein